jgi:Uma2 family endonuclease
MIPPIVWRGNAPGRQLWLHCQTKVWTPLSKPQRGEINIASVTTWKTTPLAQGESPMSALSQNSHNYITPEEYLTKEHKTEYRNEYFDGEIFAMAGASEAHNQIITNLMIEIGTQFKKRPCRVHSNDMRVKITPTGLYTYPDVVAVCDKPYFDDDQKDTLLNPTVIIEVLSNSTADYDRGTKFEHYRKLDSLVEYVLIAQDKYHVEHYVRQYTYQWLFSETSDLQKTIELSSIQCHLALAEIYDKVKQ